MKRLARYLARSAERSRRRTEAASATTISRAARDVIGPMGWQRSAAWEVLDAHGDTYVQSFDRRLPPSIFVSERDRLRANLPMPLSERCIEDTNRSPG